MCQHLSMCCQQWRSVRFSQHWQYIGSQCRRNVSGWLVYMFCVYIEKANTYLSGPSWGSHSGSVKQNMVNGICLRTKVIYDHVILRRRVQVLTLWLILHLSGPPFLSDTEQKRIWSYFRHFRKTLKTDGKWGRNIGPSVKQGLGF